MLKNMLIGMAMGMANVIPGVSGGTIAFISGIYDSIIEAISEFIKNKDKRKEYILLLTQVGFGAVLGIIFIAKILEMLFKIHPKPTKFFFVGLILGSIPFIINKMKNNKEKDKSSKKKWALRILVFIFAVSIVAIMSLFKVEEVSKDLAFNNFNMLYALKLVLCGALAAGAMVLPGVSGSLLLILLGEYYNILHFVNDRKLFPITLVAFGAGLGILIFAKVIDFALRKFYNETMFFILGLVIGSLYEIFPGFDLNIKELFISLLAVLLGLALAYGTGKINKSN